MIDIKSIKIGDRFTCDNHGLCYVIWINESDGMRSFTMKTAVGYHLEPEDARAFIEIFKPVLDPNDLMKEIL